MFGRLGSVDVLPGAQDGRADADGGRDGVAVVQGPGEDDVVIRGESGAPVVVAMSDGLLPGAAGVLDEHVEADAQLVGVLGAEVDLVVSLSR